MLIIYARQEQCPWAGWQACLYGSLLTSRGQLIKSLAHRHTYHIEIIFNYSSLILFTSLHGLILNVAMVGYADT